MRVGAAREPGWHAHSAFLLPAVRDLLDVVRQEEEVPLRAHLRPAPEREATHASRIDSMHDQRERATLDVRTFPEGRVHSYCTVSTFEVSGSHRRGTQGPE